MNFQELIQSIGHPSPIPHKRVVSEQDLFKLYSAAVTRAYESVIEYCNKQAKDFEIADTNRFKAGVFATLMTLKFELTQRIKNLDWSYKCPRE